MRLDRRQCLTFETRRRHFSVFDREQRSARPAIKDKHETRFRDLSHGSDLFSVSGHQAWRRRKIQVPDVILYALEILHPFARSGFQGEHTMREQIVSDAV